MKKITGIFFVRIFLLGIFIFVNFPYVCCADTWKEVTFYDATMGTLVPINLSFGMPKNYESFHDERTGTYWGTPQDIKKIKQSLKSGTPTINAEIQQPVISLYYSMTVGYFRDNDKFSSEESLKALSIKYSRKKMGVYPALLFTIDFNNKKIFSCSIATGMATNVIAIEVMKANETFLNEFIDEIRCSDKGGLTKEPGIKSLAEPKIGNIIKHN